MIDPLSLALLFARFQESGVGLTVNFSPAVILLLVVQIVMLARWTASSDARHKASEERDRVSAKRLDGHDADIASLNDARSEVGNRVIVLEARADNTDREFERQHEEEQDLRTAVSEVLKQRGAA